LSTTDGDGAADGHRRHAAEEQRELQPPAGEEEVIAVLGEERRRDADAEHREHVETDDDVVDRVDDTHGTPAPLGRLVTASLVAANRGPATAPDAFMVTKRQRPHRRFRH